MLRRALLRLILLLTLVLGTRLPAPTAAAPAAQPPVPGRCIDGVLPHGALSRICIPSSGWNGDLVIWGHGYVGRDEPLGFYHLTWPGGLVIPDVAQQLGFAFATTSYRQNGFAILEGAEDVVELVRAFERIPEVRRSDLPRHTYMLGTSEGGLITTLLLERHPELFSGGLATCAPIGGFQKQIEYAGDFRVLFDYYFPGLLPGDARTVPPELMADWNRVYVPRIREAATASPDKAMQILKTTHATIPPDDLRSIADILEGGAQLWYTTFADDTLARLRAAYGNRTRWYWGSDNDLLLNLAVQRFDPERQALNRIRAYEPTGKVSRPLVTLHTTGDEIVPFWHELLYSAKVDAAGSGENVTQVPIFRYGHCNFTGDEALAGFAILVLQVAGDEQATRIAADAPRAREQVRLDFDRVRRGMNR